LGRISLSTLKKIAPNRSKSNRRIKNGKKCRVWLVTRAGRVKTQEKRTPPKIKNRKKINYEKEKVFLHLLDPISIKGTT